MDVHSIRVRARRQTIRAAANAVIGGGWSEAEWCNALLQHWPYQRLYSCSTLQCNTEQDLMLEGYAIEQAVSITHVLPCVRAMGTWEPVTSSRSVRVSVKLILCSKKREGRSYGSLNGSVYRKENKFCERNRGHTFWLFMKMIHLIILLDEMVDTISDVGSI